ncbi:MAG: cell division protein ZapA [Aristaeellaceae bacterium]
MAKQKTTVRVAGREYTLVSEQTPAYMNRVASYVDRKISETALATRLSADKAAVLTALNIADELMKSHDENSRLRREMMALRQEVEEARQQASTQRSQQDA